MTTGVALPGIISLAQWQRAESLARQDTLKSLQPPKERDYLTARRISKFPKWLTTGMMIALVIVASAAFWISAGKLIVASDTALGYLSENSRLSQFWLTGAIIAGLLLSEVSSFLFSLASAIYNGGLSRKIFRAAAVLSAVFAILGNVTVTALHIQQQQGLAAYVWFLTVFAPVLVLALSLILERQVLTALEERAQASVDYEIARRSYGEYAAAPEKHPDYQRNLYVRIMDAYRRKLGAGSPLLDDPEIARALFARDAMAYLPNFTTPAIQAGQPVRDAIPATVEPTNA